MRMRLEYCCGICYSASCSEQRSNTFTFCSGSWRPQGAGNLPHVSSCCTCAVVWVRFGIHVMDASRVIYDRPLLVKATKDALDLGANARARDQTGATPLLTAAALVCMQEESARMYVWSSMSTADQSACLHHPPRATSTSPSDCSGTHVAWHRTPQRTARRNRTLSRLFLKPNQKWARMLRLVPVAWASVQWTEHRQHHDHQRQRLQQYQQRWVQTHCQRTRHATGVWTCVIWVTTVVSSPWSKLCLADTDRLEMGWIECWIRWMFASLVSLHAWTQIENNPRDEINVNIEIISRMVSYLLYLCVRGQMVRLLVASKSDVSCVC